MTSPPLITIGLTCYNASATIQRAVQSAQNQSGVNVEIIVVDDCSTDNSVNVLKNISGIQVIQHESNLGPAGARNTILKQARGQFVAFFDDDDVSASDRVMTQYERIIAYEKTHGTDLVVCYASGERVYPNGYKLPLRAIGSEEPVPRGAGLAQRILFFGGPKDWVYGSGTPTCSLMARADVFECVGGFDENFRRVEDLDFAVRLALANAHFIGCPQPLFTQYATTGSDKTHEKNLTAELQLVEKHKDYLQSIGQYVYAKTWPRVRFYHFTKNYPAMAMALFGLMLRYPLQTIRHLMVTGPARLKHEAKMETKP